MSTVQTSMAAQAASAGEQSFWSRLRTSRNFTALWFMLPAAAFLILFLAYPLGLGVWMSFTDERIGRAGVFVGLENYQWLWDDAILGCQCSIRCSIRSSPASSNSPSGSIWRCC